jgi:large subunit ribosomal protein L23|tara:strand:+ start:3410 stop:3694 length:285 start_codon:yes stop_codon:yes gene_type:complete
MKAASNIVKQILLTEKGTRLSELENKYLFKVAINSNKLEIKKAVEELLDVKVIAVNTMRRKGKKKRERTANYGKTAAWKRAVVTLHEDDKISMI